jgi:hypothetical protein
MTHRRQLIILAAAGLLAAFAAAPAGSAAAAAPYRIAVTFDASGVAAWLHTDGVGTTPTASLATSGTGTVTRTTWVGASIPPDVLSVPGVVATDTHVGVFPAYATSGTNFAAVKVTPGAFGANDVLAPGTQDLTFGADVKFDPALPADARTEDNGNNVIQRGLSQGDQYKIQIDGKGTPKVFKASCFTRDLGQTASSVVNNTVLTAGNWYRLRCTRTTVSGKDFLTLTVENVSAGTMPVPATNPGVVLSNLDYPDATAAKPYPVSIGAKVKGDGTLDSAASDQFNGRIDNGYVAIG